MDTPAMDKPNTRQKTTSANNIFKGSIFVQDSTDGNVNGLVCIAGVMIFHLCL
jgi:hypothetical protein